jgi:hypothetical protein
MRQRVRKKPMEGATAALDYLLRIMRDKDQDARSLCKRSAKLPGAAYPRSMSKWI